MYLAETIPAGSSPSFSSQTILFFIMMFSGWIIYLFLDIGAFNKSTPDIGFRETIKLYWKKNCYETEASVILLIAFALLYQFNQLQGFLNFLGLQFSNSSDTPLGFALVLGVNVKAIPIILRKVMNPIKYDEAELRATRQNTGNITPATHNRI